MDDMEIEALDYKLTRLQIGKSTCIKPGQWAYLCTDGSLHRLTNEGYYFAWKCDMWSSCYWNNGGWVLGTISHSKLRLIREIEKVGPYPQWTRGFSKGGEATKHQEANA